MAETNKTTSQLIQEKMEELQSLAEQQANEQKAEGYTGKRVSIFAVCGVTEGDKEKRTGELTAIITGDEYGIQSAVRRVCQDHPVIADVIHEAVCDIQAPHPLEQLMETIFKNR